MSDVQVPEISVPEVPVKKIVKITLDNMPQDVIDSDKVGAVLEFDYHVGKFMKLNEDVYRELSRENQLAYQFARGSYEREKEWQEKFPGMDRSVGVEVGGPRNEPTGKFGDRAFRREAVEMNRRSGAGFASATKRLANVQSDEFKRKFDLVWKRPDELQQVGYQGGSLVTPEDGVEFSVDATGSHFEIKSTLSVEPELIAVKYLKEDHEKILREPGEKSRRRIDAYDKAAEADMAKDGGLPFTPGPRANVQGKFKKLL